MPDPERPSVRGLIEDLLVMKGAHLSLDEALAGFPATLQGAKPCGVPHSAWELLEHMRLAQEDILDFSRNPAYQERTFPDDYWPATSAPPHDKAWDNAVQKFQRDLAEMQVLVADPACDLLTQFPHGQGQTLLREALVLADHNSYHLGQLTFLRKMLEAQAAQG